MSNETGLAGGSSPDVIVIDTSGMMPATTSLSFNRDTGGLSIASSHRDYDLFVDGAFHSTGSLDGRKLRGDRINRIIDSQLAERFLYWRIATSASTSAIGSNLSADWTLADGNTAYVATAAGADESSTAVAFHCPIEGPAIAIRAGSSYSFQARIALHRCRATLRMAFCDEAGNELKAFQKPVSVPRLGGRKLDDYALCHLTAKAPSGSARLRLEIVKSKTLEGGDSFLFFTHPALCRTAELVAYPDLVNDLPEELAVGFFTAATETIYTGQSPVPDEALDGGWHKVAVRNRRTGESHAIPVALPQSIRGGARILGFEGSVLVAHVDVPPGWSNPVTVSLWIDGRPVEPPSATEAGTGSLRLPLPAGSCDGRAHIFDLRMGKSGQLLGQFAAIAPVAATPWPALQKHCATPLPGHLAPLAGYRYASLAAGGGPAAPDGPGLAELHAILLEGFERPRRDFRPLPFPKAESPQVSVVIPAHNRFDVTYVCLAALLFAATRVSFEVIVVDDGSADTTRDLDRIAPGVTVLRHETARGFVGACNAGAAAARGDYIAFLNNDTEPTAYWLDEMLFAFQNFDAVGLVGAKLIYGNGDLQEAGGIVWETGDPWNYGRGGNPHDPRYSYTRQADYVSGAALMIPAALWKQLDGFGAEYAPAYFEDTDLAFKVKNAGRKVVYAARAVVVHHEGISHGTDAEEATGLKRYQEVNRPKFKRKWSALYAGNGKVGDNVDRAKDRGIARRVLFIDKEFPRPDRDAGSYAAIQEIRMFQALGCKVTFAPLNMAYLGRHTDDLQRLGVEAIHTPFHSSVAAFLQARGGEFDLIYITRYGVAGQLLDQLRQHAPQARLVINVADLHFLRLMREARVAGDDTALTAALDTREAELAVLGRAELVLTYSTIEQAVIASHIARGPRTGIVPWVIDTLPLEAGFAARRDVAFLGGFGHPPNISAVKYFAAEVMPLLRKSLPGCRFLVYGSNVPPDIQALAGDDIIIAGYVREVAEVFDSCRVFVAPLLSGAGMKGKVLDCMAAGIPSVLSPVAAEGIGLRDGIDTLIARTPAEWGEAIARLYRDEALWTAMSANVQDLARRHYGFAAAVTALAEALAAIEFYVTPSSHSLCVTAARPLFETGPAPAAEAEMIPARPG